MVDLVIFDSDGVLVDSEPIALRVFAQAAASEGAIIGTAEAVRLFRGLKIADCISEIERRSGRRVRESFLADVRHATALAFEAELKAVDGIHETLAEIKTLICVASNGPMSKLMHTLRLTQLLDCFEGRIFSAYEVGSWKPDPIVSARSQDSEVDPSDCVVVEDSESGIRAAKAAGMRVLGFTNGQTEASFELSALGVELFDRMAQLPSLLD